MRNTWVTIKGIISRESKTNCPEFFQINNVLTKDKTIIANGFNIYFANIGYNLASKMKNNCNTAYGDFLSNPSLSSFTFQPITEEKRVMRIITCSKYNTHSEPLFKELNLIKLEDIRKLQELKFYYKLVHRQLPSYFNCIYVTTINAIHQHNTRQS